MKKILFLIHDLGHGGAEKVLVNLVNNMDKTKYDITVLALFGGGVNEKKLASHIHYKTIFHRAFKGNSHVMKLFSPSFLHNKFVKEDYDIEISYLEGPAARIISGCQNMNTKLVSWIHCTMHSMDEIAYSFRNKTEANKCYKRFDRNVFVSGSVQESFLKHCPNINAPIVLYNTNESKYILEKSVEQIDESVAFENCFKWCGVGKLVENKGYDRMLRIQKRLILEGYPVHFFAIGDGTQKQMLINYCKENDIKDSVSFLGYQENPYKYVSRCDLYVCASHAEGFSTAATEALIVGTPVCTVDVAGMKEMLGYNNEYGIVTENNEQALFEGIKSLLDNPGLLSHYKEQAIIRGKCFNTESTVKAVEEMLESLL